RFKWPLCRNPSAMTPEDVPDAGHSSCQLLELLLTPQPYPALPCRLNPPIPWNHSEPPGGLQGPRWHIELQPWAGPAQSLDEEALRFLQYISTTQ
ncbi:Hypothetical predicted protein, partial [Marmota monax]